MMERGATSYTTPAGKTYTLYEDMLRQNHTLIAGATGSGKSVALNAVLHTALMDSPVMVRFILLDPKMVELSEYADLPHTLRYACTSKDMLAALEEAVGIIEARYTDMQRRKLRFYDGSDIYVVIDELADLMTTMKREAAPLIQRIGQIGRAARVHLLCCTQRPTADILPRYITCNMDARLGLRTANRQDSRNIIDAAGCEKFPRPVDVGKAYGYYRNGADLTLYQIPMIEEEERQRILSYWRGQPKPKSIKPGRSGFNLFGRH